MVKCICINDSEKSKFIDAKEWIEKGKEYTIIFISFHPNQGNIQGCLLAEVSLTEKSKPFEYYKLSRFAIRLEYIKAFYELAKDCSEMDDTFSLEELLKETEVEVC